MSERTFLDWPFFDDHHRRLADELESWCAANLAGDHGGDVDEACRALARRLGAAGWLRYCVPAAYGGVHENLDVRSLALIRETLARHDGLADFVFAMQGLGSGTISLFGNEEQKSFYLPSVATGREIAAFALSEPNAGSDVAALETVFWPDREGLNVKGTKTFISNGGIADFYVVFAREEGTSGSGGISAIVVHAGANGVDASERIEVIAPHPLATVRLDTYTSHASLIGERGRGYAQAMATLDFFRTTVGAAALGFARRALDEASVRVRERRLRGAALADNAVVQSMLAEMALDVDAAALLVYRAAWVRDVEGRRNSREAAMAKLFATDGAQQVIDKAVQLFGGLGVTVGVPVERLYREIRALRNYEGASEVQKIVSARHRLSGARA
jgi:acyl-CoA dehydrogenase